MRATVAGKSEWRFRGLGERLAGRPGVYLIPYAEALLILKRPRREASFVDCSVEFTKSSRAVSIVIALLCDMPGETPNTVDDAPKPLPAICGAVKPWIPKRPSRTNLPVSAALLHTPTASLLPSGMSLCKHATCGPRMQVPIRTPH